MFWYSGILKEMKSGIFMFVGFATVLIFASLTSANGFSEWEWAINTELAPGTTVSVLDLNDCEIKLILAHFFEDSPQLKREKAAWITKNTKGEFGFVDWPNTTQNSTQIWNAVLPDNIIAIAHTHPNHTDPKPSTQDRLVAKQRNISVYTLTRKAIWSVTPEGKTTQHVNRAWFNNYKEKCGTD